jgi:hypothetical protein
MFVKKIIFMLFFIFFLGGCISKIYSKPKSIFLVFKTPSFKYADLGFFYENKTSLKLELYGSGNSLMRLNINENSICMSLLECLSNERFNQKILSKYYPKGILENLFRGKPIFNSLNMNKNRNGFTQNIIKVNKYNIEYSVLNNQIIFRDTIQHILIKIKEVN